MLAKYSLGWGLPWSWLPRVLKQRAPDIPIFRLVLAFPERCLTCSTLESPTEGLLTDLIWNRQGKVLSDQVGPLPYALAAWCHSRGGVTSRTSRQGRRSRMAHDCLAQLGVNTTTLKLSSRLFVLWDKKELAVVSKVLLRRKKHDKTWQEIGL